MPGFFALLYISCLGALLGANSPLHASSSHGIAMHKSLKYPRDFTHFTYNAPEAKKGGILKLAETGTFDSLNPFNIRGIVAAGLGFGNYLYFEPLMRRSDDEPFSLYGYIAETVEVAPDRSWIEFNLNPKARWHDGMPITPEDVIASATFFRDHGRVNQRLYYSQIESMEKISQHALRITFKKDRHNKIDAELPMIVALLTIIPKSEIDKGKANDVTLSPIMGSGPYRISAVVPGRSITYTREPHHWAKDLPILRGVNNFDTIHYDYYRDRHVMLEAFKAGAFDVITETDPNMWVNAYNFPAVNQGLVKKVEIEHRRPCGLKGLVFNTRHDLFKDRRVRQAIVQLYDGNWANKTFFQGKYTRTQSFFQNSPFAADKLPTAAELHILEPFRNSIPAEVFTSIFRTEDDKPLKVRIKEALNLLSEAGWEMHGGKLHHKESGKPFAFEILLLDQHEEKLASALVRPLKQIGIDVKLRLSEPTQYEMRRINYDFDMVMHHYGESLCPGNEQKFYWTSQASETPGSRNYAGIKDPAIDALCERVPDAATYDELITLVRCLDRLLQFGYYMIPLFHAEKEYFAFWDKFTFPPIDPEVGNDVRRWWTKHMPSE